MNVVEVLRERVFEDGEELTSVVVATIAPETASSLLSMLSEKVPLQSFNLSHLKRIRRMDGVLELVVCPEQSTTNLSLDMHSIFPRFRIARVPKFPPTNTAEFEAWGRHWPVIFRPSDVDKQRERGLTASEMAEVERIFELVDNDLRCFQCVASAEAPASSSTRRGGAVIINPKTGQIISSASHAIRYLQTKSSLVSLLNHPLYSPTMLCIEGTAATVRGEVGIVGLVEEVLLSTRGCATHSTSTSHILPPIPPAEGVRIDVFSSIESQFPVCTHRIISPVSSEEDEEPYLCSGLDLYLDREPDLMSSMALVHSRIRRVYFRRSDPRSGALSSVGALHTLRSLNHHFRVFQCLEPHD